MARYEISVEGPLDPSVLMELGDFEADQRPAMTVVRASLDGQDGLPDLLAQLQTQGHELIEVRQIDPDENGHPARHLEGGFGQPEPL
jgi:hypothetical protein